MDEKDLDYYLQEISVQQIDYDYIKDVNPNIVNWYGVSNEEGIIAYFGDENDAFNFRLSYINRKLNP